jgi:antitoxin CptB
MNQQYFSDDLQLGRLRWQCRRGMLELDLLLLEFLENRYLKLDAKDKRAFVDLLAYPDNLLQVWLLSGGGETEIDTKVGHIVSSIRDRGERFAGD